MPTSGSAARWAQSVEDQITDVESLRRLFLKQFVPDTALDYQTKLRELKYPDPNYPNEALEGLFARYVEYCQEGYHARTEADLDMHVMHLIDALPIH